jgi:hypothetical protein
MRMGKASRTKQDGDRRSRIAAQREAERRAEQRKRIYLAGGSVLAVVIVVVALVLFNLNKGSGTAASSSNGPTGTALAQLTKQVTDVPSSVTEKVAGGGVPTSILVSTPTSADITAAATNLGSYLATVNGTALTSNGKPEVLYLGAEFCPYCAVERWAMINALSRFGTFTGLTTSHSSSSDADPNTPTWTFYKSSFSSKYITFTSVEETTNYRTGNSSSTSVPYVTLQTPTAAENALQAEYDPPTQGQGSPIPFIDFGNKYAEVGNLSPLNPTLAAGKTWTDMAAAMNDPSSKLGQALIGNANYITAATCELTGNQPATACTPTIKTLEGNLGK